MSNPTSFWASATLSIVASWLTKRSSSLSRFSSCPWSDAIIAFNQIDDNWWSSFSDNSPTLASAKALSASQFAYPLFGHRWCFLQFFRHHLWRTLMLLSPYLLREHLRSSWYRSWSCDICSSAFSLVCPILMHVHCLPQYRRSQYVHCIFYRHASSLLHRHSMVYRFWWWGRLMQIRFN